MNLRAFSCSTASAGSIVLRRRGRPSSLVPGRSQRRQEPALPRVPPSTSPRCRRAHAPRAGPREMESPAALPTRARPGSRTTGPRRPRERVYAGSRLAHALFAERRPTGVVVALWGRERRRRAGRVISASGGPGRPPRFPGEARLAPRAQPCALCYQHPGVANGGAPGPPGSLRRAPAGAGLLPRVAAVVSALVRGGLSSPLLMVHHLKFTSCSGASLHAQNNYQKRLVTVVQGGGRCEGAVAAPWQGM